MTAMASAGSDLGLAAAAPEPLKLEEIHSHFRPSVTCGPGGAGRWVLITFPEIIYEVRGTAYKPTQQLHEF